MSMHEMEAYIEAAVRAVALSALPLQRKRDLIHSLFDMQTYGDCGFINLRTIDEMLACRYTFLFEPSQMHDYEERREFYDSQGDDDDEGIDMGDVYFYESEDDESDGPVLVCVDSGSPAWEAMIKAGAIQGEGAQPVQRVDNLEVLKEVNPMVDQAAKDENAFVRDYLRQGMMATALLTGASDDMNDAEFKKIMGMSREEFEHLADA